MNQWIFLSKGGQDPYIGMMAQGIGSIVTNTDHFRYEDSTSPIVLRGILKHKIMQRCWQDGRDFYYMDTGYFGNGINKIFHRIVKNDLQHGAIVARSSDRWRALGINLPQTRCKGRRIIVAAPDDKPCRFYGIDQGTWLEHTISELKRHTDIPIEIRQRAIRRVDRVIHDPLHVVLKNDVHALVTFNSNSAVESILAGVPAFVLAPSHAAAPVSNRDLAQIESPYWPDQDKLLAWASHLAWGQFHVQELKNGTAYRILNEH